MQFLLPFNIPQSLLLRLVKEEAGPHSNPSSAEGNIRTSVGPPQFLLRKQREGIVSLISARRLEEFRLGHWTGKIHFGSY